MIYVAQKQFLGNMLTITQVKNYLKIDQDVTADDELIASLISSVYRLFDAYTGVAPVLAVYECVGYSTKPKEELPRIPVVEIMNQSSPEIILLDDETLQVPVNTKYSFTLKAGYTETPEEIKETLLRAIAELYTKRSAEPNIAAMFRPFRRRLL